MLLLITMVLGAGSLACRVQIGLQPANAAPDQAAAAPVVNAAPVNVKADTSPAPQAAAPQAAPAQPVQADNPEAAPAPVVEQPAPVQPAPSSTPTPVPLIPAVHPPARIIAPAINLDAPVGVTTWTVQSQNGDQFSQWVIPEDAAGWHVNSALPGHGSNVVLSGHHNLGAEVFRYVVDLKPGDAVTLRADGRDYPYFVTDRFIVPERDAPEEQRRQNAQWIMATVDERLTLVTCWPYNDNSHRVIVIAKPAW
jgi:sortase A